MNKINNLIKFAALFERAAHDSYNKTISIKLAIYFPNEDEVPIDFESVIWKYPEAIESLPRAWARLTPEPFPSFEEVDFFIYDNDLLARTKDQLTQFSRSLERGGMPGWS